MENVNLKAIGIICVSIFVLEIVAFIVLNRRMKIAASGQAAEIRKRKFNEAYIKYSNNVLTRSSFRRIVMALSALTCYSVDQVREESVKLFRKAVLTSAMMPLFVLVLFQNVMLGAIAFLLGYIYYNMTVDGRIDKLYEGIIVDTSNCVQTIHDGYIASGNIPTAVLDCDRGTYLDKAVSRIYDILTAIDGEEILYHFKRATPVRMLGTLASVCFIMNNEGDTEANGTELTAFESTMVALRREADTEVNRLRKTRMAFSSLKGVALTGLIASPFLDMFLLSAMPGVSLYLKGLYGSIEKMLIIGITIIVYYIISVINRPTIASQVDKNDFVDSLCDIRWIRSQVQSIIPKKFKTRQKLERLLKDSISSKTLEYIYTMKPIASICAMIAMALVLFGFVLTAKYNLWHNTGTLSVLESTQEMTDKLARQLVELDEIYMTSKVQMDDETTLELVKSKLTGVNDLDALNHVTRLQQKWKSYYGLSFKWYYVLIVYLAGVVAWFSPELSLMLRKMLVQFEATEDVMQLQTLMIALSNTKMDVYKTLNWLTAESTIHKAPLHYAYLEYPSDPELALQRLKDSVQSKDLKRMVAKLERAVYSLSLQDAFNDIKMDKEQSLITSEMLQDEVIESKKQWAKLLAGVPTAIAIMGGFVLPILILGVVQLMNSLSSL